HSVVTQEIFRKVQTEMEAESPQSSNGSDTPPPNVDGDGDGDGGAEEAQKEDTSRDPEEGSPTDGSSSPVMAACSKSPPPIQVDGQEEEQDHVSAKPEESVTLEEVFVREEDLGGVVDGAF